MPDDTIIIDEDGVITEGTWRSHGSHINLTDLVELESSCCVEYIDPGDTTLGEEADEIDISETMTPSGIITMRDRPKQFDQPKEVQMLTFTNILIVAVIALIVCKVISPRLTWLNVFKAFIRLILKPFNRKSAEVQDQWQKAKYDEEIQ